MVEKASQNLKEIICKNKMLEQRVQELFEKVEFLEQKETTKEYLPLDQKLEFVHRRLQFITSEIAKINKHIERDNLFNGELKPLDVKPNSKEILVVCANYPHKDSLYGGAFIPARVKAYIKEGFNVSVCIAKYPEGKKTTTIEEHEGVKIYIGEFSLLEDRIREVNPAAIVIHSPIIQNYNIFKKLKIENRLIMVFHGSEVRDVGHLYYNFNNQILQKLNGVLQTDLNRKYVALDAFRDKKIAKVFVSKFLKDLAIKDVGVAPFNAYVISNLIENDIFNYKEKTKEDRLKIFSVRPYDNKNYGGDLIVDTILKLSQKSFFYQLSFHIQGFGKTFQEKTAPLRSLKNVKIVDGVLKKEEIAKLHKQYGIALIPTRFDTQGMSIGEAMSSGLVPVTNRVAAIPEFVPENCAMLAEDNNVEQLVDGIVKLYYDSNLFLEKSFNAAQHIRNICSVEQTVFKEIELIKSIIK